MSKASGFVGAFIGIVLTVGGFAGLLLGLKDGNVGAILGGLFLWAIFAKLASRH